MAHQFLYLTKRLYDLLKSAVISSDYLTITAEELTELKGSGQL